MPENTSERGTARVTERSRAAVKAALDTRAHMPVSEEMVEALEWAVRAAAREESDYIDRCRRDIAQQPENEMLHRANAAELAVKEARARALRSVLEAARQADPLVGRLEHYERALRYLADPESWHGDPASHEAMLLGHDTPYELARAALSATPGLRRADPLVEENERLKHDVEKYKLMAFAPLGDNHHNAAMCPYCSPTYAALNAGDPS
jgi:hypothetical protein